MARGQHYLGAKEYRSYLRRLERGDACPHGAGLAPLRDSRQLVELGLIQTSATFECHVRDRPR